MRRIALVGDIGSGKTFLACQVALDGLFSRKYERVIITRPTVSKEDIGFLPGTLEEKMMPWIAPLRDNLEYLFGDKMALDMHMDQPFI